MPQAPNYASIGLGFHDPVVAENYLKGRPSYSPAVADVVIEAYAANSNQPQHPLTVAEPGAGTGLLTEVIVKWNATHHEISSYHASDSSIPMLAGILKTPVLADAVEQNLLHVSEKTFTQDYAPQGQTDIILTGQAKHWDTRAGEVDASVDRTLRLLAKGGAEFAIYNAPVADNSGFTKELNELINTLCPDPYYQAMTSGDPGRFLGNDAKSNFGTYFNKLAERGNGEVFYKTLKNLTEYKTAEEIISYVFSNAFVNKKAKEISGLEAQLKKRVTELFEKYKGESASGGVYYGNTTVIFGAVGLKNDECQKSGNRLPTSPVGTNDFNLG